MVTGYLFLNAGAHKLFFSAQHLGELGGSLPAPLVAAAALVELVCGAALAAGLLTRWAAAPLALLMLADIAVVHPPLKAIAEDTGYEYALLRLAACAALALLGPGKMALDNVLASRR